MPIDPGAAALAQGGMNVYGSGLQGLMTIRQNKLNRRWSEKMYARQQADMIKFWNMQNAYNHPKAQFDRMVGSGLNPKLMYEKGSPGTAGPIQTPDMQPVDFRVPDFGSGISAAGGALSNMYNLRIGHAQANLLDAQSKKVMVEAALGELEYAFNAVTFKDRQQNEFYKQLQASHNLEAAVQDYEIKGKEHIRNMEQMTADLLKTVAETANIKATKAQIDATVDNILKSTQLKQIQIDTGEQTWIKAIPAIKSLVIEFLTETGRFAPNN
jgi:hypothetical protein